MSSAAYDTAIRKKPGAGTSADALFFELALEDLGRAADLFRPIHDQTDGVDGWVSLEVSPLLAYDTASTLVAAKALFARAKRPNLLIKIPGTRDRKSTRLNSSHGYISYAVFCLKKKKNRHPVE